ncbi:methyltransferase family protein [Marinobacter sp.]|uniref:methyltransferase family protein n=1 Tax=Marinobacter sp. TaxID=50741 RepID=UPI003566235E
MIKALFLLFALASYGLGFLALLALAGFLLNLGPWGIDTGAPGDGLAAIAANTLLLFGYFGLHSVMARPGFKRRWTRILPPALERSTYVLVAGLTLLLVLTTWTPLPYSLWQLEGDSARTFVYALHSLGWVVMVAATFHINHFEFFGLRQVWRHLRSLPPTEVPFSARFLYGLARHPISLGWMIVFWAAPDMSLGHLLMAAIATGYILVITPVEEADLERQVGPIYRDYRARVPAFVPRLRRARPERIRNRKSLVNCPDR